MLMKLCTSQFGCNLDQILRMESGKVSGIVNGIDADLYNPQTDAPFRLSFSQEDLSGKPRIRQNYKRELACQLERMFLWWELFLV